MGWPTMSDYQEVLQNPRNCFMDPQLKDGRPTLNPLGLPQPITGGFASVYQVANGRARWAVRCFLHNIPDLRERYDRISRYLKPRSLTYMVGFEYLPQGVRVRGEWLPVLKMEWVDGDTLNRWVEKNLARKKALRGLADRWLALVASLERASISHCDLQHGNVLVNGGDLKLIDYDGMYVPPLKGRGSHEKGHPAYQHPGRDTTNFDESVDRFSSFVIYVSLLALAEAPEIWRTTNNGDNLIFSGSDFVKPAESPVFKALERLNEPIPRLARALKEGCLRPLSQAPRLLDVASAKGAPAPPVPPPAPPPAAKSPDAPARWELSWERPGQAAERHIHKVPILGSRKVTWRVLGIPLGKRQVRQVERYEDKVEERRMQVGGHRAAVTVLAFSPDGRHLATGSRDRTVRVWLVSSGQEAAPPLDAGAAAPSLAFLANRSVLAVALGARGLVLWNFGLHRQVVHIPAPDGSRFEAVAASPDGGWVAAGGTGRSVFFWKTDRAHLAGGVQGLDGRAAALAIAPDASSVACATRNGRLELVERPSGKPRWSVKTGVGPLASVAFSRSGDRIIGAAAGGAVGLWRTKDGGEAGRRPPPVPGGRSAALSDDGRHVIVGLEAGSARIVEIEPHKEAGSAGADGLSAAAAAIAPNGRLAALTSRRGAFALWKRP